MSRKSPLIAEIAIGVVISSLISWAYLTRWYPIESFNLKTFDIFSKVAEKPAPNNDILIVGIDEESVNKLGRWPWPRPLIGSLIDEVAAKSPKVIGLNIAFLEPDQNLGLEEIANLESEYKSLLKKHKKQFVEKKFPSKDFEEFLTTLSEAKDNMNGDLALGQSVEDSATVVVPMEMKEGEPLGENLEKLPNFIVNQKLSLAAPDNTFPPGPSAEAAIPPIPAVAKGAYAIGFNNFFPDVDGSLRRVATFMRYGINFYPSFALQVLREFLNLQPEAIKWNPEDGLRIFKAKVPLDDEGKTYVKFLGPVGTFKYYSAIEILMGSVPDNAFDKKIVLMGVNLSGLSENFVTPGGERMTGLEILANHIANVLNQDFISRPEWAEKVELLFILIAALIVVIALPFLRARFAIPISGIIFGLFIGIALFLFIKKGMWVSPTYGVFLLASGFMVLVGKRYIFTERGKEMVEAEGVETNKMLGLSFQGQGMLDLAFEKFRKCPLDNQMKDLLYNLGLDMERKRQFTKAAAVYEHISAVDHKYKDIQEKIQLLKKAGEGAVFGGVGKKGSESTVVVDGLGQNTTLGRYEVVKELGRGAMGIVYLGRDPKINRQVAIKTLRFEDEVSEEQMKSIKERFFREAESAGNLTHPNIIRIFDAGEDQDVAYIAMELLEGHDLKALCEKGNLLPIPRVIEIITTVADALDYAHKQGVVHRDIKPANIMLLKENHIRITDFGIARIQTSSKTATGAVLGTPAYMSPEQVNGQKADGRSDIYSLGVTLYELLTGEKPFQADTIAALLYRIANVDHSNPREYNPKIPPCLVAVLNKALAKKPEDRYQTGGEMAQDLKNCAQEIGAEIQVPSATQEAAKSVPPVQKEPEAPSPQKTEQGPAGKKPVPEVKKEETKAPEKPKLAFQSPPIPKSEALAKTQADSNLNNEFLSELKEAFNIKQDIEEAPDQEPIFFEQKKIPTQSVETIPDTTKPKKELEKTVVLPPEEKMPTQPEKTIVLPPEEVKDIKVEKTIIEKTIVEGPPLKVNPNDIPTLSNIEHNFHPENLKKDTETEDENKKKPQNNWEF